MTATVTWREGLAFAATSGSGHQVLLDGERKSGASPMEALLMAMGGCSGIDVVLILQKMREDVRGCRCALTAVRAEEDPKVFTRIHAHYVVSGKGLDPAKVARAIALSAEKYCSASVMLGKTASISHDFEVIEA
ncbi:MAG: OsmC family protein [Pseudomonadota bacterium]